MNIINIHRLNLYRDYIFLSQKKGTSILQNLNLLKLQIIELLHKHQKVTIVAELLELKQPTITFHMKSLEKEFGVKLFDARMGKILLTEAGQALLHYAIKINALTHESRRVVSEFGRLRKGNLHIGASYVPATYLLPLVIHHFSRQYPDVNISLCVKKAPTIMQMAERHEIDFGLVSTVPFEAPSLHIGTICEDDLVLIYAPHHPLASVPHITKQHIIASPFVLHSQDSSTRTITNQWLAEEKIAFSSYLELDSLEAIKQMVILGDHAAFVSSMAIQAELKQQLLQSAPIPNYSMERNTYAIYNRDRHPTGLVHQFMNSVLDVARPNINW